MNKLGKILTAFGCLIGFLGFVVGMLAAFNPASVEPFEDFMNSPSVGKFMDNYFPFVMLGFFAIVFLAAFSPLILGAIKKSKMRARLKMMGQKGEARITAVQDTGITINNNPYIKLILDVNGTRAEINTTVSRIGIPRPGDVIKVVYDPSDPTIVLPEHEMN